MIGKRYLDTLQLFSHLSPDEKYAFYNAQSVYYDTQKASQKALEAKKDQLILVPFLEHKKEFFRLYLSIADRYHDLNELDSALYYAQMAVSHITDTTYAYNSGLFLKFPVARVQLSDYISFTNFYINILKPEFFKLVFHYHLAANTHHIFNE